MKLNILVGLVTSVWSDQSVFGGLRSCPSTVNSCDTKNTDSCCAPKLGRYLFSLQWIDRAGPADKFTIHGFWPDYCDGRQGPRSGCDSRRHYTSIGDKLKAINSTLVDQLDTYWPSKFGDNPSFWSHEWNKHGTCVSTVEPRCYNNYIPYQDVHDYFMIVLNLYHRFDYFGSLKKAGITPGRVHNRDDMVRALRSDLGLDVTLKCRGNVLNEVRVHYMAAGREILNPTKSTDHHSCPKKVNFIRKSPGRVASSSHSTHRSPLLVQTPDLQTIHLDTTSNLLGY